MKFTVGQKIQLFDDFQKFQVAAVFKSKIRLQSFDKLTLFDIGRSSLRVLLKNATEIKQQTNTIQNDSISGNV